jgi:uncharacterized repeat protein (TIGR03803 family)
MQGKRLHCTKKGVFMAFYTFWLLSALLPVRVGAQTFEVLHTFQGPDGANPITPVILDSEGNLYGTTEAGGAGKCTSEGCGTAFMLNKLGEEVALYSFGGSNGYEPFSGLLRDAEGNFYGTTQYGGGATSGCPDRAVGCGIAYRLNRTGREVDYQFQGEQDGFNPTGPLVEDSMGNFYGTTRFGGSGGFGTVFKIDATGKETVLYSFTGSADGCDPTAGVVVDSVGNLYGVTVAGGLGFCSSGYGVVFKVDSGGNETVLHTFGISDGANPDSVLLLDPNGKLYGTTASGGNSEECGFPGCGTIFELSPQRDGMWMETVLYSFCSRPDCIDGEEPGAGPLVRDSLGNFYGTTYFGGQSGDGVVFELNSGGKESVIHSFTGGADGANPAAGLTMDDSGNLYSTTEDGGSPCFTSYTCGVVFRVTP